ncbi:hypothetical protein B0H17DRAFT_1185996 [Mycena rosella]|uniref:Uncharacterized protein n=1 Tax=Mycena rosella TaxID=1033263 RepID=A0AAD7CNY4_MYCRO|nr:hypothetical protein B0H17DRAFT_1185996 [Mycena rosella]
MRIKWSNFHGKWPPSGPGAAVLVRKCADSRYPGARDGVCMVSRLIQGAIRCAFQARIEWSNFQRKRTRFEAGADVLVEILSLPDVWVLAGAFLGHSGSYDALSSDVDSEYDYSEVHDECLRLEPQKVGTVDRYMKQCQDAWDGDTGNKKSGLAKVTILNEGAVISCAVLI